LDEILIGFILVARYDEVPRYQPTKSIPQTSQRTNPACTASLEPKRAPPKYLSVGSKLPSNPARTPPSTFLFLPIQLSKSRTNRSRFERPSIYRSPAPMSTRIISNTHCLDHPSSGRPVRAPTPNRPQGLNPRTARAEPEPSDRLNPAPDPSTRPASTAQAHQSE
jgi:hypothetical protein